MEVEFIIDAGYQYLLDWLHAHVAKYGAPRLSTDDVGIGGPDDQTLVVTHESGWMLLYVPVFKPTSVGDDDAVADFRFHHTENEPFIRFNVLPLSNTRTKVVALWHKTPESRSLWQAADDNKVEGFQVVNVYMRHLLGEIANDWPEAKDSIDQALSRSQGPSALLRDEHDRLGGGYSEQILVPLDVLDVSVSRRIEGYTVKLATAVRDEIVPGGRIIYRLSWREFGRIGEVELHKAEIDTTWLTVRYVQPADKAQRDNIRKHMNLVISALRSGLAEDGIWERHEQELDRRDKEKKLMDSRATSEIADETVSTLSSSSIEQNKEINLQTWPGGRPRDPDYDEAFRRISDGEDEKVVFDWFCRKKGWSKPGRAERNSFKQAIKRRGKVHKDT